MKELKKIEVDGDVIYLNKKVNSIFKGWNIVYPIKNEDGTTNWKHLIAGRSWWNLVFVLIFVLVWLGFIFEYHSNLESCTNAMSEINIYKQKYETTMPDLLPEVADSLKQIPNVTLGGMEG